MVLPLRDGGRVGRRQPHLRSPGPRCTGLLFSGCLASLAIAPHVTLFLTCPPLRPRRPRRRSQRRQVVAPQRPRRPAPGHRESRAQTTRLPVVGLRTEGTPRSSFTTCPASSIRRTSCRPGCRAPPATPSKRRPHPPSPSRSRRSGAAVRAGRRARDDHRRHRSLVVYTKGDLISAERRAELEQTWLRRVGRERRWGSIRYSPGSRRICRRARTSSIPMTSARSRFASSSVEYLREAAFALPRGRAPVCVQCGGRGVSRRRAARVHSGELVRRTGITKANRHRCGWSHDQGDRGAGACAHGRAARRAGLSRSLGRVLPHWRTDAAALTRFGFPDSFSRRSRDAGPRTPPDSGVSQVQG